MNNQRRRRSIETLNLSSNLPHDLILQILLRLPVRSLLRFKSVCKSWLSLISDPEFGKSHFDLAAAPTHRCLVKINDFKFESLDVDAPLHNYESSEVNLKFPLLPSPPGYNGYFDENYIQILGSCRGFIPVFYPGGGVVVWNPSTGVQRSIAESADDLEEKIYQNLYGFGYDKSTDDYLLVIIDLIPLDYLQEQYLVTVADYRPSIELFSLKTSSVFYTEAIQYANMGLMDSSLVGRFLNEALHWLVISVETNLHAIIAFDLVERSLSEIPLSRSLARKLKHEKYEYRLQVIGECLSLCYLGGRTSKAEIWMMKKYRMQSSWTKLFVFSTHNIPEELFFFPICFTKHGRIFGTNGFKRLMIFNDKGKLLDQCKPWPDKHNSLFSLLDCSMYRESLLPLPNNFEEESSDFGEASKDDDFEEASEDDDFKEASEDDDFEESSQDDQLTSSLEEAREDDQK